MEFLQNTIFLTVEHWLSISVPSSRLFSLYLLSALGLAFLSYLSFKAVEAKNCPDGISEGLVKYIFNAKIFTHRSSIQDYTFFFVNGFIFFGILSQLLVGMHTFANVFIGLFNITFGPLEQPLFDVTPFWILVYTIVVTLFFDFAVYLVHYFHHRFPILWEFHKVHHSAEVLNPITLYRMHPVDLFLTGLGIAVLTGLAFAGFFYMTGKEPSPYTLFNLNIIFFAFYIMGYNLRHSHIWLNYPKWLSYIFISPAQHQIHHSSDPKHFDKNMGLIFSFWDYLFGTLYIPESYEKLQYGLSRDNPNPYKSIKDLYLRPIINAIAILRHQTNWRKFSIAVASLVLFVTVFLGFFIWERFVLANQFKLPSVHLEDLTWTEVQKTQQLGFDTILIPTGGTEQNGPHVILGKHNFIIKHTSEQIAKTIGKVLIAPVMAYVPEGQVSPKLTRHMRYPGTVTLPENLFEKVLESAIRSYKAHGFKTILIMGDSGDSMKVQDRLAQRLDEQWRNENMHVIHIDKYYRENGQMDWLKSQGYTERDIGYHAGIRDTSELLAVRPSGVRNRPLVAAIKGQTGSNGKAIFASKKIGKKMLTLKIQAAVRQIRNAREKIKNDPKHK